MALKLNFDLEIVFYSSKHAQHNATYIIRGFRYLNFNIYSVHLKRVNLRVSSHCVVVCHYDVGCVITDKHCDVDFPRLTSPDSFPDQTAEGKATQVVWVDSPTRPAKVAVAFKQMWWKTTVTTSTLGVVSTDTAEVPRRRHPAVHTGCVTATYTLAILVTWLISKYTDTVKIHYDIWWLNNFNM